MAPDDQHFIMIRTGVRHDAPGEIILVQNFVEELEAETRRRATARRSGQR